MPFDVEFAEKISQEMDCEAQKASLLLDACGEIDRLRQQVAALLANRVPVQDWAEARDRAEAAEALAEKYRKALVEIRRLAHLNAKEYERERVRTPLVQDMDSIAIEAMNALTDSPESDEPDECVIHAWDFERRICMKCGAKGDGTGGVLADSPESAEDKKA